jgi:hypothetical protein
MRFRLVTALVAYLVGSGLAAPNRYHTHAGRAIATLNHEATRSLTTAHGSRGSAALASLDSEASAVKIGEIADLLNTLVETNNDGAGGQVSARQEEPGPPGQALEEILDMLSDLLAVVPVLGPLLEELINSLKGLLQAGISLGTIDLQALTDNLVSVLGQPQKRALLARQQEEPSVSLQEILSTLSSVLGAVPLLGPVLQQLVDAIAGLLEVGLILSEIPPELLTENLDEEVGEEPPPDEQSPPEDDVVS